MDGTSSGQDAETTAHPDPPSAVAGTDDPRLAAVEPIRQTVAVRCPPDRAFDLFTEGMGAWWPVESYSRAVSEFKDDGVAVTCLEFQPRMGGAILEHLSDG